MKIELSQEELSQFLTHERELLALVEHHKGLTNEWRTRFQNSEDDLASARSQNADLVREIEQLQAQFQPHGLSLRDVSSLIEMFTSGKKIEAIKKLREVFGCGLREAKEAIEGNLHR